MGTESLVNYMEKYNLELDEEFEDRLMTYPKRPWPQFINHENHHLVTNEALDFLERCLRYDYVNYI